MFVNPTAQANAGVYRDALAAKARQDSGLLVTVIAQQHIVVAATHPVEDV